MALWVCSGEAGCGTKYAVGLSRCPRCHNTTFHEDGDPMAKITRHGGASDDTAPAQEDAETGEDLAAKPDVEETSADEPEGGEESSPGSSSSASTGAQPTSSEPSELPRRKPARTTGSRSTKGRTDSSSAPSTDGDPTEATSAADDK